MMLTDKSVFQFKNTYTYICVCVYICLYVCHLCIQKNFKLSRISTLLKREFCGERKLLYVTACVLAHRENTTKFMRLQLSLDPNFWQI